jgi:hypothetical protein
VIVEVFRCLDRVRQVFDFDSGTDQAKYSAQYFKHVTTP